MPEAGKDIIRRYLQDAVAAEAAFEKQLREFAAGSDHVEIRQLFEEHAEETRRQHDRLAARLEALGGAPSGWKSVVGTLLGAAPRAARMGHHPAEKQTQDLMMAFGVEQSEVAMYEALIGACEAAGDRETAELGLAIQQEERNAASRIWERIREHAAEAYFTVSGAQCAGAKAA